MDEVHIYLVKVSVGHLAPGTEFGRSGTSQRISESSTRGPIIYSPWDENITSEHLFKNVIKGGHADYMYSRSHHINSSDSYPHIKESGQETQTLTKKLRLPE